MCLGQHTFVDDLPITHWYTIAGVKIYPFHIDADGRTWQMYAVPGKNKGKWYVPDEPFMWPHNGQMEPAEHRGRPPRIASQYQQLELFDFRKLI